MKKNDMSLLKSTNGTNYLVPFILITFCFALWGFANDITNPMVKAFSKIFRMSVTEGTLVQVAFYGGYFTMAFPAAIFVKRFSYKSGILLGLALYAIGAFLFIPAKATGLYYSFLLAYFIITCGLSFLETSANPYILSMGDEESSTRRLNLAQSFNPFGSLMGMFVAMEFIQSKLSPLSTRQRSELDSPSFEALKQSDLSVLISPYLFIGFVIVIVFVIIWIKNMPKSVSSYDESNNFSSTFRRLFSNRNYKEGVIAQFFYVGVQIMCWTFIIQYGTRIFMNEGMSERGAEILSQEYNIAAMVIFCASRFVCTYILKYINPSRLLFVFSIIGIILTALVIVFDNRTGLICLVAISGCMSLMFPTIYGISLQGLGEDAKIGAAGLIMAVLGGSVLPPIQAMIIDCKPVFGISSESISFVMPLFCFTVIALYAKRTMLRNKSCI